MTTLTRRLRRAWLAARYGVRVRETYAGPVIASPRRLRPPVVAEVMRLYAGDGTGERRRDGDREARA